LLLWGCFSWGLLFFGGGVICKGLATLSRHNLVSKPNSTTPANNNTPRPTTTAAALSQRLQPLPRSRARCQRGGRAPGQHEARWVAGRSVYDCRVLLLSLSVCMCLSLSDLITSVVRRSSTARDQCRLFHPYLPTPTLHPTR